MEKNYCPYCMKETSREVCPACGKSRRECTFSPWQLPYGTILENRYITGAVLGEGGFGITYLGIDSRLGMRVAVKEYFPSNLVSRYAQKSLDVSFSSGAEPNFEKGKKRFLREAKTMAKMEKQPEIVGVKDFFEAFKTAYIIMEYVEGETLKARVRRSGRIGAAELLSMMQPLMRALKVMHDEGLIHRDISPDNIMIENGRLRLIDFGCAREGITGKETLTIVLKHGYSPVEQYMQHGQGPWTDIYALCATMYFCLTQTAPPQAVDRLLDDELAAPNSLGAGLGRKQEEALLKGLAVKPENRLRSVDELYAALYPEDISFPAAEKTAGRYKEAAGNLSDDSGRETAGSLSESSGREGAESLPENSSGQRVKNLTESSGRETTGNLRENDGRQTAKSPIENGGREKTAKSVPAGTGTSGTARTEDIIEVVDYKVKKQGAASKEAGEDKRSSPQTAAGTHTRTKSKNLSGTFAPQENEEETPKEQVFEEGSFAQAFEGKNTPSGADKKEEYSKEEEIRDRAPYTRHIPEKYIKLWRVIAGAAAAAILLAAAVLVILKPWKQSAGDVNVTDESTAQESTSQEAVSEIYWDYDEETQTLTISGTGRMDDYDEVYAPWYSYIEEIKTVVVEEGITYIGQSVFEGCTALESVSLSDTVREIGPEAFKYCESLSEIVLPESLLAIDKNAFHGCNALTRITLPAAVTTVEERAFFYCKGLVSIDVDEENENFTSQDGVLFSKDMSELVAYPAGKGESSYSIPESVTKIAAYAFNGNSNIMQVSILGNVEEIGDQAFYCCSSLEGVEVDASNPNYASQDGVLFSGNMETLIYYPNGLTDAAYEVPAEVVLIENYAFFNCSFLTDITLNEGIETIGTMAFAYCSSLQQLRIPSSAVVIYDHAFYGCGASVLYIPENVEEIGEYAFDGCENLEDIYYGGSKEEWNEINDESSEEALSSINVHYNWAV